MIVSQKIVAETEIICQPTLPAAVVDVQYRLCVAKETDFQVDVASPSTPIFGSTSAEISLNSVASYSDSIQDTLIDSTAVKFIPSIRSGSYADIGLRSYMEDEHIRIDDLSAYLGSLCFMPSAFYAVFDGHGGPEAAAYVKRNAMKFFFEDADLPKTSDIDAVLLEALVDSHRKAFLLADLALADERSVSSSCGTTALTALVLGRHLLVANAGDCRAVLCRNGKAIDMSQDHRPSYLPERKRVEDSGGYIDDEYVNGSLAVTRALGDWDLKMPLGSASPLISEPDVRQIMITEDDQFLIIGCDGIWDVMSSQHAVSLVCCALKRHNDPERCARELVMEAIERHSPDNLTAVVICFSSPNHAKSSPQRQRLRCCGLSEEARNRLKSFLGGN
ncbi:protein phosphatase 2C 13 [Tripterygium wilfordii]|uniref:protein-serine/threonine phosphatase n=1 Tax=Tripterygium wilfordii TaxID=458696 RepID=A0A7J7CXG6_TRIWF|nr:probable protein phosphatase 2C 13 [Tripterygium wilfordii]KAF5738791.1 protein phosphatase 2C 13 [Tripterygium wilfordii]